MHEYTAVVRLNVLGVTIHKIAVEEWSLLVFKNKNEASLLPTWWMLRNYVLLGMYTLMFNRLHCSWVNSI